MTIRFSKEEVSELLIHEAERLFKAMDKPSDSLVAYIFQDEGEVVFEVSRDENFG